MEFGKRQCIPIAHSLCKYAQMVYTVTTDHIFKMGPVEPKPVPMTWHQACILYHSYLLSHYLASENGSKTGSYKLLVIR